MLDAVVAAFQHDTDRQHINDYITTIINRNISSEIDKLYITAFYLRDIHCGKGERDVFYHIIKQLALHQPNNTQCIISLIPFYGCWRDMWEIMCPELEDAILAYVKEVFMADLTYCATDQISKMSYLCKWLPREKSNPRMAKKIANYMYKGSLRSRLIQYRKEASYMNQIKQTVEIDMCRGKWRQIIPAMIPVMCLKRNMFALLNITCDGGVRYPDSDDRIACREHFLEYNRLLT